MTRASGRRGARRRRASHRVQPCALLRRHEGLVGTQRLGVLLPLEHVDGLLTGELRTSHDLLGRPGLALELPQLARGTRHRFCGASVARADLPFTARSRTAAYGRFSTSIDTPGALVTMSRWRSDHPHRRQRPAGIAADIGRAPAPRPGDGVSDRGRRHTVRKFALTCRLQIQAGLNWSDRSGPDRPGQLGGWY